MGPALLEEIVRRVSDLVLVFSVKDNVFPDVVLDVNRVAAVRLGHGDDALLIGRAFADIVGLSAPLSTADGDRESPITASLTPCDGDVFAARGVFFRAESEGQAALVFIFQDFALTDAERAGGRSDISSRHFADYAQSPALLEREGRELETLRANSENLLENLNAVIERCELDQGTVSIVPEPVHLAEVLEKLKTRFAKKGVSVFIETPDPLPDRVETDGKRLRQALSGLLTVVAGVSSAVKLTATVTAASRAGATCAFGVFPVPDAPKRDVAEDEEYLVEKTAAMSFSETIAKKLGGAIQVVAAPDGGADAFVLNLEFKVQSESIADKASDAAFEKLRVLVVDDVAHNRLLIQKILEKGGHIPLMASNGEEALRLAREEYPDVVLMDLQMPRVDGLETTRRIRSEPDPRVRSVPIIALTAHILREDEERCYSAGMNGYIAKPFKKEELTRALRAAIAAPTPPETTRDTRKT